MSLAKRLKEYRKSKDWSHRQMAEGGGILPQSYTNFENEKSEPRMSFLINIMKNTDINWNWLIYGKGEMIRKLPAFEEDREEMLQICHEFGFNTPRKVANALGKLKFLIDEVKGFPDD